MNDLLTERLVLRKMAITDASFIQNLYNQPLFVRFIGNKNIVDIDAAKAYIESGPLQSYQDFGFGLLLVSLSDGTPIGVCGLLQRDDLPLPDLGYALDQQFFRQGYAKEACQAVLNNYPDIDSILAITNQDNEASKHLLVSLGFKEQDAHTGYPDTDIYQLKRD